MITTLVYGFTIGGILYILSIGLSLTFGSMRIVNFAHALIYTTGAYLRSSPPDSRARLPAGGGGRDGRGFHRRGDRRFVVGRLYGESLDYAIIATYAVLLIGVDLIKWIFGATPIPLSDPIGRDVGLFGISFPLYRLLIIALAISIHGGLYLFFKRRSLGRSWWRAWRTRTRFAAWASTSTGTSRSSFSSAAGGGGVLRRKPSSPARVKTVKTGTHSSTEKEPAMQERKGVITFKGNPMTLLGPEIKVGDKAPDFRVVDTGLAPVTLADFKGKVKIISAVPSLDTPTCDTETRRFNQEAANLPGNVVILTVSLDLPFAQKRWCAAAGIDKVKTLSDYQDRSFASAYGVLIKELKLLSRSIFVVDGSDTVRYVQHVKEASGEPDYAAVLAAARGLT